MKASDIEDHDILAAIERMNAEKVSEGGSTIGASRWDVQKHFPEMPEKVVDAKLRKLIARGLTDGCGCGCRGDHNLTERGRALLSEADQG